MSTREQSDGGVIEKEDVKQEKPKLFKVIMINDDFTTFPFVTGLLCDVFRKTLSEAEEITQQIHEKGKGICGVYTLDVAETKIQICQTRARQEEHPLQLTLEPE